MASWTSVDPTQAGETRSIVQECLACPEAELEIGGGDLAHDRQATQTDLRRRPSYLHAMQGVCICGGTDVQVSGDVDGLGERHHQYPAS